MSYNGTADVYIYAYWAIVAVVVVVIPLIGGIGVLCAYYCCCRESCRSQLGSNLFGSNPQQQQQQQQQQPGRAVQNPNYAGSHGQVFVTPGQMQYPPQQYQPQQYPPQQYQPQQYQPQQYQPQQYAQQQAANFANPPPEYSEK